MIWALFLDDERYPAQLPGLDCGTWRIARNVGDALWYIQQYGLPAHMSLDHDLGAGKLDGMDFCHKLIGYLIKTDQPIPPYYIHSQNPVGRENMAKLLERYIAYREESVA